jgi:hypothetical protein
MDQQPVKFTPKAVLTARVYRAHPIPAGMSEAQYKDLIDAHDTSVGHWEDLGEIATTEDGTLHVGQ